MSVSNHKPVQAQILEAQLEETGFKNLAAEVQQNLEPNEEIQEDLMMYGTAIAMGQKLEEHEFEYTETGGWAVFTHLLDEYGVEAFQNWRGSDDSDKNLRGITGPEHQDIKEILEDPQTGYGPENNRCQTVNRSRTSNHETGEKYTVKLEVRDREVVKHDLLVNNSIEDEFYDFDKVEPAGYDGAELNVPPIDEVITAKLQSYHNKPSRARDKTDIAALLSVAESKSSQDPDYSAESLYQEVGSSSLEGFKEVEEDHSISHPGDILKNVATELSHDMPLLQSQNHYLPSQEYLNGLK